MGGRLSATPFGESKKGEKDACEYSNRSNEGIHSGFDDG
jgi:hypothetical protein